jgi:hypothetical protein
MNISRQIFDDAVERLKQDIDKTSFEERARKVVRLIFQVSDPNWIRRHLQDFTTDWSIPPSIRLAMFFRLQAIAPEDPNDYAALAVFLGLFYQDMDDWAAGLRDALEDKTGLLR